MNPDLLNTLMVNALPVMIAAAVALYNFIIQFLPANRHAQLSSLASNLDHIATSTVQAVEQFMGSEAGQVKKAAASTDVANILAATGIHGVPTEMIDNAIEAAVYSMNLFDKPVVTPSPSAPAATHAIPANVALANVPDAVSAGQNTQAA